MATDAGKSSLFSAEYDPVVHLNEIFPEPSSLSSLEAIQLHLTAHVEHIDSEIRRATLTLQEKQSSTGEQVAELQSELEELFRNVEAVKEKAEKAEAVMTGLTKGIRRLDCGKHNLTLSMTALKRLQMLSTWILAVRRKANWKQRHMRNCLFSARQDSIKRRPNCFR